MMLRIVVCLTFFLAVSFAQEGPRFEVVAIKAVPRSTPASDLAGTIRMAFDVDERGVQISGYPLRLILTRAFRVQPPQLDAPDFVSDEFFAIQATFPAGATRDQLPEMLQAMLAERFKLTYHREIRNYQMNVLTVGKSGMKLTRLPDGAQSPTRRNRLPDGTTRETQTGTVASLFAVMNSFGGLQLVDGTGLDGVYTWVQDRPPTTPGVSYQDALQDSLKAMIEAAGLKLETRTVPKETIVVDHLERSPTEN